VHDAAGHGLATIAMQAGIALLMLDERPDQARESLEAIRSTSMQALNELRSALDLIDPKTPDHDLARLVDGVRAAGLSVVVEPAEPDVPAHLQGTVYRVVRESLTNVLRHAGPTGAVVRVTGDPSEFVLEVTDRGSGLSWPVEGRGLAGMRARVAEAGGTFGAGPCEGGGFRVVARFPRETA
jgi:signal transduction histidine kinase